jgi:hypothetical protein
LGSNNAKCTQPYPLPLPFQSPILPCSSTLTDDTAPLSFSTSVAGRAHVPPLSPASPLPSRPHLHIPPLSDHPTASDGGMTTSPSFRRRRDERLPRSASRSSVASRNLAWLLATACGGRDGRGSFFSLPYANTRTARSGRPHLHLTSAALARFEPPLAAPCSAGPRPPLSPPPSLPPLVPPPPPCILPPQVHTVDDDSELQDGSTGQKGESVWVASSRVGLVTG